MAQLPATSINVGELKLGHQVIQVGKYTKHDYVLTFANDVKVI